MRLCGFCSPPWDTWKRRQAHPGRVAAARAATLGAPRSIWHRVSSGRRIWMSRKAQPRIPRSVDVDPRSAERASEFYFQYQTKDGAHSQPRPLFSWARRGQPGREGKYFLLLIFSARCGLEYRVQSVGRRGGLPWGGFHIRLNPRWTRLTRQWWSFFDLFHADYVESLTGWWALSGLTYQTVLTPCCAGHGKPVRELFLFAWGNLLLFGRSRSIFIILLPKTFKTTFENKV